MAEPKSPIGESVSQGRKISRKITRHENTILAIILAGIVGVMAVVTKGKSIAAANVSNVLLQSSVRGIASVGQAFVILTGGIDLAVEGVSLVSALLGAGLMTLSEPLSLVTTPWTIAAATPMMLLLGLGFGAANGAFGLPHRYSRAHCHAGYVADSQRHRL